MSGFSQILSVLQTVPIKSIPLNGLDILLVFVFVFYAFEGYSIGFVQALLDFLSFIISFLAGLKGYTFIATFLISHFALPIGFANAISFFITAALVEVLLGLALRFLIPKRIGQASGALQSANKWLGIVPSLLSSFVLTSFLLTLIISLPVSPFLKHTITQSVIGSRLVMNASVVEQSLSSVFGVAVTDTLNFLTVEPQSNQTIQLHFTTTLVSIDQNAEKYMLQLVNNERKKQGLAPLAGDDRLTDVARAHSKDMFARGYFSHYTPDGLSPFDRMAKANIPFSSAGENLAFAPNTDLAMQGLMKSPGHRANILSSSYHKVGIGVIDGGIYGEMFTQDFTD